MYPDTVNNTYNNPILNSMYNYQHLIIIKEIIKEAFDALEKPCYSVITLFS